MTDIYHNGKKLERIDLTFDGEAPPIITPHLSPQLTTSRQYVRRSLAAISRKP
jgi:hypothetical protein